MAHTPPTLRSRAILIAAVATAYFVTAKAGLLLAAENESVTAVWPPTGLALAALVLWGRWMWPAVALGALLANLTTEAPLGGVLGITLGNTLEAVAGAALLSWMGFRPSLERVRDVQWLLVAALASTAISATVGVGSLWLAGAVEGDAVASAWRTWWMGDLGGDLLVATSIFVLASHWRVLARSGSAIEALVSLGAVAAIGTFAFVTEDALTYLVFPPAFWVAFRFRQLGAVAAGVLLAGIGIYFTARGHGPFAFGSPDASLVRSQAFACVAAATALAVAAVRTERLRAESERRAAELATRALQDNEHRIRESAARMAEAQEIARFGSWEWSPASGEVKWSEILYALYGLSADEFAPSFEGYIERVHPGDREAVAQKISAALAARTSFSFEERIVRPDGEVRLLRSQGRPILDEQGQVMRMVGVCQDVTELRDAEAARREAEARFRNAFENAPIGVALVALDSDGGGRFLDVNRSLCEITGYTEEELLQRTSDELTDPRDRDADRGLRARLLAAEIDSYSTEKRCVRGDGESIWTLVDASLVPEADGTPGYAIVQLQDISERKRFEGQLQYLADHDALTGLVNRRRFLDDLDALVGRHARYGGQAAVLVIDLDQFKYVNDTLGHAVGDDLVRRVGALLGERLRATDLVARLGGDEFAVLLPEIDADGARAVADDLLGEIRERAVVVSAGRRMRLSASIGIAVFGQERDLTGEMVLVNADIAMYDAKQSGRNRAALLETLDEPKTEMRARMTWIERVRAALDGDRFVLYAQPIVDLRGGSLPRYELLLRMIGDEGEIIPPGAFLPVAEEFGLIQAIDAWVVRQAVALGAERQRAGDPVELEVNLSGVSLTDPGVLDAIESEIAGSGIDPRLLVFEVTETAAIVNIEKANRFARRLSDLGCGFALDDFGAGFGSFYYLKHLPFDYLKIDGEFIRNLPRSEPDQLTVKAIVQIAQGLGKQTVAEFVEDRETLELLREYGVDYVQGYHLGRPAPTEPGWRTALPGHRPATSAAT